MEETSLKNPLREGLTAERVAPPCSLVIYGASGDLTQRKLVPALFGLYQKHLLPSCFHLIGTSRTEMSSETFRARLKDFLRQSGTQFSDSLWQGFADNIDYIAGEYDDLNVFERLATLLRETDRMKCTMHNRIFYLA
ncbi:MAG: glucose-6-phosphate dehydrogenase, partial [Deltaproteobacteria bacterium]